MRLSVSARRHWPRLRSSRKGRSSLSIDSSEHQCCGSRALAVKRSLPDRYFPTAVRKFALYLLRVRGALRAPWGQSLLRSFLASRSFPPPPPATCCPPSEHTQTLIGLPPKRLDSAPSNHHFIT